MRRSGHPSGRPRISRAGCQSGCRIQRARKGVTRGLQRAMRTREVMQCCRWRGPIRRRVVFAERGEAVVDLQEAAFQHDQRARVGEAALADLLVEPGKALENDHRGQSATSFGGSVGMRRAAAGGANDSGPSSGRRGACRRGRHGTGSRGYVSGAASGGKNMGVSDAIPGELSSPIRAWSPAPEETRGRAPGRLWINCASGRNVPLQAGSRPSRKCLHRPAKGGIGYRFSHRAAPCPAA
jgi:hypothetical protein